MPLTSAHGDGSDIDPYAEEPTEAPSQPLTQDSAEETAGHVAESHVAGEPELPVEDVDPRDVRIAALEEQARHKDSHIGTLEGENRGYRTVLDKYGPQAEAEAAPEEPASIFDDPGTRAVINKAMEEDPAAAMEVIGRRLEADSRATARAASAEAVAPVRAQTEEDRRMQQFTQIVTAEMDAAGRDLPGAQAIVDEYRASNGMSGALVAAIQQKGAYLKSNGADPRIAVAPGSFRAAIAEILLAGGAEAAPEPTPVAAAPTAARPKARTAPRRVPAESSNDDPSDIYGQGIVNAKGPSDKVAEMFGKVK